MKRAGRSRPKPLTRAWPGGKSCGGRRLAMAAATSHVRHRCPGSWCFPLARYRVTVGAGAPSVQPASAPHGPQATAQSMGARTLTDQVRRVEACGRQCPCAHVRVSEREVARFKILNQSERMRRRPTEVALHDGKSAERRLRDVSETFGRPIANAAAANPRRAQRANAVNATCADAASASLVFIAGQRRSQRCARPGTACLHASPPHTPLCSQSRQHP